MPTLPTVELREDTLVLKGDWTLSAAAPEFPNLKANTTVDISAVKDWDSALVTALWRLRRSRNVTVSLRGAPANMEKLLALAEGGAERGAVSQTLGSPASKVGITHKIHSESKRYKAAVWLRNISNSFADALAFLGEIVMAIGRFSSAKTRAHFRLNDWLVEFWQAGYKALPIVAFISFLVGLIMAFVSAIQLKLFGASIYVADLVGLSMTREMGALMTAIIMAGRTGAAYAAQIGSMKRSEELDALRTMGLNPIDMVVLPRVMALTWMMPLLSVFATFVGVFAGLIVSDSILGVSVFQYINEISNAVPVRHLFIGIIKAFVYGFLVAFAGAWRGVRCGNSADSVGYAATSAVVLGLTLIVFANAIFAIVLNALNL